MLVLYYRSTHLPFLQVHHGFYNAYNDSILRPGVLDAIQTAKELYGDTDILVTGHSMGGAMAALCGLDLRVIIQNLELSFMISMHFGLHISTWHMHQAIYLLFHEQYKK